MKLFFAALCFLALVGCAAPRTATEIAADVCAKNGGRLATFEYDGGDYKFTCAEASP